MKLEVDGQGQTDDIEAGANVCAGAGGLDNERFHGCYCFFFCVLFIDYAEVRNLKESKVLRQASKERVQWRANQDGASFNPKTDCFSQKKLSRIHIRKPKVTSGRIGRFNGAWIMPIVEFVQYFE